MKHYGFNDFKFQSEKKTYTGLLYQLLYGTDDSNTFTLLL